MHYIMNGIQYFMQSKDLKNTNSKTLSDKQSNVSLITSENLTIFSKIYSKSIDFLHYINLQIHRSLGSNKYKKNFYNIQMKN